MQHSQHRHLTISNWGDLEALGGRHVSTLPRYWISRLYLALSTLATIGVIWLESDSLMHRLITQSGPAGWYLVGILAFVAIVALADSIVNDLLPDRYRLKAAKRYRHLVYVAIAMGLASMSYVFLAVGGGWRPVVLPFWVDTMFAAMVAFLDLFQRHRRPQ